MIFFFFFLEKNGALCVTRHQGATAVFPPGRVVQSVDVGLASLPVPHKLDVADAHLLFWRLPELQFLWRFHLHESHDLSSQLDHSQLEGWSTWHPGVGVHSQHNLRQSVASRRFLVRADPAGQLFVPTKFAGDVPVRVRVLVYFHNEGEPLVQYTRSGRARPVVPQASPPT